MVSQNRLALGSNSSGYSRDMRRWLGRFPDFPAAQCLANFSVPTRGAIGLQTTLKQCTSEGTTRPSLVDQHVRTHNRARVRFRRLHKLHKNTTDTRNSLREMFDCLPGARAPSTQLRNSRKERVCLNVGDVYNVGSKPGQLVPADHWCSKRAILAHPGRSCPTFCGFSQPIGLIRVYMWPG